MSDRGKPPGALFLGRSSIFSEDNPGTSISSRQQRMATTLQTGQLQDSTNAQDIPVPEHLSLDHRGTYAVLKWMKPPQLHQALFRLEFFKAGQHQRTIDTNQTEFTFNDLQQGVCYTISVSTILQNGCQSKLSKTFTTEYGVLDTSPGPIMANHPARDLTPHGFSGSQREGIGPRSYSTPTYDLTEAPEFQHGGGTYPSSITKVIPVPEHLTVSSIAPSSARLSWEVSPEMEQIPHNFLVLCKSEGTEIKSISTESCSADITGLKPGTEYTVRVYTQLQGKSQPATVQMKTEYGVLDTSPGPILDNHPARDLTQHGLSGSQRKGIGPRSYSTPTHDLTEAPEFQHGGGTYPSSIIKEYGVLDTSPGHIMDNHPARDLTPHGFSGSQREGTGPRSCSTPTQDLTQAPELQHGGGTHPSSITKEYGVLETSPGPIMDNHPVRDLTQHGFSGSQRKGIGPRSYSTPTYDLTQARKFQHGGGTYPSSIIKGYGHELSDLLTALGLDHLHGGRLTLSSVLEINRNTVTDETALNLKQLPRTFLSKLMMSNLNARNIIAECNSFTDADDDYSEAIHPLDLITALFHCSDPFLQQEMVSKMSMCQFAVPLLLPNCDTQQCTLMLWTMRDLVKKYRLQSLAGGSAFIEGSIVEMDIPIVSFVRLGESSLPKSQILNKLISNPHQHNDTFVHHDMECGDVPRRISDGLVEVSWYLPGGKANIDIFTQPVAMANLRGDGRSFKTQMSFLCQTSAAVFIFSDDLEGDLSILANRENKAGLSVPLFLVTKSQSKINKDTCRRYGINEQNVIIKKRLNDFVKALRVCVKNVIENNPIKTKLENMATIPPESILVDEKCSECTHGRLNAEGITNNIQDVVKFKEDQLPLHGDIWKQISQLEKENCRMRNAGKDIEEYKSSLQADGNKQRRKQQQKDVSKAMKLFIYGISQPESQRLFFLKWLKMQLDTLSRRNLSLLREQYKECCRNTPQDKKEISRLDEKISNCSLGPEHFFRELGQIYECACSLPENNPARQKVQHLPALCAQMLLDGFPVELVDGDASNIPMKWISEVLTQLHRLVDSNSRILVMTVLGVQSTGKSTLLNTMFGVQFAVSSGRCTRGAFMLLIKVSEEFRSELNCDFIMVIDTEGLKSPELAGLDTSYEHDNELATLVIGLSDITIINVAMENNTEMKDILQIVVHAFLRMKEIGKKPRCLFVHQNVSDMSAHDSNMRDRKKLVDQLDEMTRAAAKMEKKLAYKKFSDVMVYDPDEDSYYIPGLWHGTPPMAPVNAGYSEAVYKLKKALIGSVKIADDVKRNDAKGFLRWTEGLWEAVKYEKFIFSFRNSLVADAYAHICTEYNKWEWSFQKEMNSWLLAKETIISNFGKTGSDGQLVHHRGHVTDLIAEASRKLAEEEKKIHQNLETYFKSKDSSVALVEKYKEDFKNSARSLKREIESSLNASLLKAVEIKKGLEQVNMIKSTQTEKIQKMVEELVQSCQTRKRELFDEDLSREFQNMWRKLVSELSSVKLQKQDVVNDALFVLKKHFEATGKSRNMLKNLTLDHFRIAGETQFRVDSKRITVLQKAGGLLTRFSSSHYQKETEQLCDSIIKDCDRFVSDNIKSKKSYQKTYIKEILNIIDDRRDNEKDLALSEECECELKFHICWKAAIIFQGMHDRFIRDNDPKICLERCKERFWEEFKDLYHNRDQCMKKATEVTNGCLTTAVKDYITKRLGADIADEMRMGDGGVDFSTRTHFQYALLKQLLNDNTFDKFKEYIVSYKTFVNRWIFDRIIKTFSKDDKWQKLKLKHLSEVVLKITGAITQAKEETEEITDMKKFIQKIRAQLKDQLTFQEDDYFIVIKTVNTRQFASNLIDCLIDMQKSLTDEYNRLISKEDFHEAMRTLPSKPHELLFSRLCGCGEQCPFCKTPCDAGGQDHKTHFSGMHRCRGLGGRSWTDSDKLVTDICTTAVLSDVTFSSSETKGERHPYKDYREIYPSWEIAGDSSMEASDYWKYVLMKYNKEFAEAYNAKPADIPPAWRELTLNQAMISLRKSFNINA